jgi:RNA polymerase nonessential primary-like sigma factor
MPSITIASSAGGVVPSGDPLRSYLRDIGRVPLLSHEQEITLGRQVQELMRLEELREELRMRAGGEEPEAERLAQEAGLTPVLLRRRLQRAGGRRSGWWRRTCGWW